MKFQGKYSIMWAQRRGKCTRMSSQDEEKLRRDQKDGWRERKKVGKRTWDVTHSHLPQT